MTSTGTPRRTPAAGARRWARTAAACVLLLAGAAAAQLAMGRVPWCKDGSLRPWSWDVFSMHNSQHLLDPYTFSHVQHGILFFAGLWLVAGVTGRLAPHARFLLAVAIEVAWEVLENTPFVIDRYREQTISLDYYGDSVLNSLADSVAMIAGYGIAASAPLWLSASLLVVIEGTMLLAIRDSLLLNVVMLLRPIDALRDWQAGLR